MSAQGLGVATRQTVFDQKVSAHRPTEMPQGLLESWFARLYLWISRREGHEHPDTTHPLRLLRARRERPPGRRAAEERNEMPPPHSITSSARASSVAGTSRPSALAVLRLITRSYLVGYC